MDNEYLKSIDVKLGALLALEVDRVLEENKTRAAGSRSLDATLSSAGIGTAEIAVLLGKSQRAVQKALERHAVRSRSARTTTRKKH